MFKNSFRILNKSHGTNMEEIPVILERLFAGPVTPIRL